MPSSPFESEKISVRDRMYTDSGQHRRLLAATQPSPTSILKGITVSWGHLSHRERTGTQSWGREEFTHREVVLGHTLDSWLMI